MIIIIVFFVCYKQVKQIIYRFVQQTYKKSQVDLKM